MPDIDEIKVMTKLTKYSSKKGFFGLEFLWVAHEQVEAEAWWSGLCKHSELSKLAARVLSLPVTTAVCEKSFSLHPHTLSNKRSRLTNELAGKLDFVNHNLKFLEPINLVNSKAKLISAKGFEEVAHYRSACSQIGTEQHSQRSLPLIGSSTPIQNRETLTKMEVAEESSDSEYNSMTSSNIPYDDDTVISDDKDTDCDVLTSNLDDIAEGLAQTQ